MEEYESPRKVFESRAPLVDEGELTSLLTSEIMTERLLARCSSAWVIGSFANPSKALDTGPHGCSDLDIFVVHEDWDLPQAATNMLLYAPGEEVPRDVPEEVEANDWRDTEPLLGPGRWDCTIVEAWNTLPEYVKQTLRNASKKGFFRNREELDEGKVRNYDVFVGQKSQLHAQLKHGQPSEMDVLPGFKLFP